MFHCAEPEEYEPTYDVQNDIDLEITSEAEDLSGLHSYVHKDHKFRVGHIECAITLRRSYEGSRNYDFTIHCVPKGIDPHWSLKLEVAYKMVLKPIGREIDDTKLFEASDDCRYFIIGPFEADEESATDAKMRASIKLIDWKAIYLPMHFDFTRRTNLSDCTLIVEGKRLYITKSILAMQCDYFRRLFDEEEEQTEFTILDALYEDMVVFLCLLYPHITSDQYPKLLKKIAQLDRLLELASRFKSPTITSLIEDTLINRTFRDNETLLLADKHCLSKLCSKMLSKLQTRSNYKSISRCAEFPKLSEELRSHLLDCVINKMSSSPVSHSTRRDPRLAGSLERNSTALLGASTSDQPSISNHSQALAALKQLYAIQRPIPPFIPVSSKHVMSPFVYTPSNSFQSPPLPSFTFRQPAMPSQPQFTVQPVSVPAPSTQSVSVPVSAPSTSQSTASLPLSIPTVGPSSSAATTASSSRVTSRPPPLKRVKEEDII